MSKIKKIKKKITALALQMEGERIAAVEHRSFFFNALEHEGKGFWALVMLSAFGVGWLVAQPQKKKQSIKRSFEFIFFSLLPQLKYLYTLFLAPGSPASRKK